MDYELGMKLDRITTLLEEILMSTTSYGYGSLTTHRQSQHSPPSSLT